MRKFRQFPESIPKIQENSPKILKIIKKFPQWLGDWELAKNGMGAYVSKNFYMLEKSEKNRKNSKNYPKIPTMAS